ncbi:hypothetical protein VDBG_08066 [Verticillium alfalfae VaMs.102]|uniref:Uncharacterized protein n=1 Tax=Verticillium alfalfae (strain VaMs.102 / ATCC MYA-4576 / FGSC 10136) TaxID=526221 RepID=C9ST41_VERA1|nr:hypothetical protein VDBG_08066 [Verticillium alfalfae VaMs.102]EEY21956.1 hypothetical protein VDBG_08066 [Verticillium alfalfae VaMs.102]
MPSEEKAPQGPLDIALPPLALPLRLLIDVQPGYRAGPNWLPFRLSLASSSLSAALPSHSLG